MNALPSSRLFLSALVGLVALLGGCDWPAPTPAPAPAPAPPVGVMRCSAWAESAPVEGQDPAVPALCSAFSTTCAQSPELCGPSRRMVARNDGLPIPLGCGDTGITTCGGHAHVDCCGLDVYGP